MDCLFGLFICWSERFLTSVTRGVSTFSFATSSKKRSKKQRATGACESAAKSGTVDTKRSLTVILPFSS